MFRITEEVFKNILSTVFNKFKPSIRAMTLRFLAQGSYQLSVGQDFMVAMAPSTVSKSLWETINILEETPCPINIKIERTELETIEAKKWFYNRTGFPGVIGAIDGTHISVVRPIKDEHLFFNRKGSHSINVMVVIINTFNSEFICTIWLWYYEYQIGVWS